MFKGNERKEFIPQIIIDILLLSGIDYIKSLPEGQDVTINDIINYCEQESKKFGKDDINFEELIRQAVSTGYDKRYFEIDDKAEERSAILNQFSESFMEILKRLNIHETYREQKVLVVGIGNGFEGKMLYADINNLALADIAPQSLAQAKKVLPQAKEYNEPADKLSSVFDDSYDLYISLRTYQSTYFDIPASLQEAKRILKNNGAIVISVACGYLNAQNEFVYGLFNPHNGVFEENRPDVFLNTIRRHLRKLKFNIVGEMRIPTEVFIFATL